MICNYKDNITFYDYVVDGYGTERFNLTAVVPSMFFQNTGWAEAGNMVAVESDAYAYVDPENAFVKSNFNRLEGMMIEANPMGDLYESRTWYRVIDVTVGQDKLLCNKIDNIVVRLKKTTEIPQYVS